MAVLYILSQRQRYHLSAELLSPHRGHQNPLLSRRGNTYYGMLGMIQELTTKGIGGGRGWRGHACMRVGEARRSITRSKPNMGEWGGTRTLAIRSSLLNFPAIRHVEMGTTKEPCKRS